MRASCTRFDNSGRRVGFTVTIFTRALLDNGKLEAHICLCSSTAIKFTLISCKNIQFTVLVHVVRFATRLRKSISMRYFRIGGRSSAMHWQKRFTVKHEFFVCAIADHHFSISHRMPCFGSIVSSRGRLCSYVARHQRAAKKMGHRMMNHRKKQQISGVK